MRSLSSFHWGIIWLVNPLLHSYPLSSPAVHATWHLFWLTSLPSLNSRRGSSACTKSTTWRRAWRWRIKITFQGGASDWSSWFCFLAVRFLWAFFLFFFLPERISGFCLAIYICTIAFCLRTQRMGGRMAWPNDLELSRFLVSPKVRCHWRLCSAAFSLFFGCWYLCSVYFQEWLMIHSSILLSLSRPLIRSASSWPWLTWPLVRYPGCKSDEMLIQERAING